MIVEAARMFLEAVRVIIKAVKKIKETVRLFVEAVRVLVEAVRVIIEAVRKIIEAISLHVSLPVKVAQHHNTPSSFWLRTSHKKGLHVFFPLNAENGFLKFKSKD